MCTCTLPLNNHKLRRILRIMEVEGVPIAIVIRDGEATIITQSTRKIAITANPTKTYLKNILEDTDQAIIYIPEKMEHPRIIPAALLVAALTVAADYETAAELIAQNLST